MRLTWSDVVAAIDGLAAPPQRLLLIGSVPMLAHGLIEDVGDIDVVTDAEAWDHLARDAVTRQGEAGDRIATLANHIELFDGWYGKQREALDADASTIDGLRVASLREVLAFKCRLRRTKDLPHIALIRQALDEH